MSTEVIETIRGRTTESNDSLVEFSSEALHAPFMLRLGALLIDYMLVMILPVFGLFSVKVFGDLGFVADRTLWFISVLLFFANIVFLSAISGRSIGKALTGLRIVNLDGTLPLRRTLLFRQTIGLLFSGLTLGLGFLFSILNKKGRSLHDYLAGTVVVSGRRRII